MKKERSILAASSPLMANEIKIQRRGNEDSINYIKLHNTVLGKFFFRVLNKLLSLVELDLHYLSHLISVPVRKKSYENMNRSPIWGPSEPPKGVFPLTGSQLVMG